MDKTWEKHQAFPTGGEESWLRGLARLAWVIPRKTRFRRRDGNPVSANRLVLETDTEHGPTHMCVEMEQGCALFRCRSAWTLRTWAIKGFGRRGSLMTEMEFPAILLGRALEYHLT